MEKEHSKELESKNYNYDKFLSKLSESPRLFLREVCETENLKVPPYDNDEDNVVYVNQLGHDIANLFNLKDTSKKRCINEMENIPLSTFWPNYNVYNDTNDYYWRINSDNNPLEVALSLVYAAGVYFTSTNVNTTYEFVLNSRVRGLQNIFAFLDYNCINGTLTQNMNTKLNPLVKKFFYELEYSKSNKELSDRIFYAYSKNNLLSSSRLQNITYEEITEVFKLSDSNFFKN